MSKAFARIKTGLREAIAHRQGLQEGVQIHVPSPTGIKAVRRRPAKPDFRLARPGCRNH